MGWCRISVTSPCITHCIIDLADPQIAFLYLSCHTVRVYFSCGTDDLHAFGAADTSGDEVFISPPARESSAPDACRSMWRVQSWNWFIIMKNSFYHHLHHIGLIHCSILQTHFWHAAGKQWVSVALSDQEGWELHFSLTVVEHPRAGSVCHHGSKNQLLFLRHSQSCRISGSLLARVRMDIFMQTQVLNYL